MRLNPWQRFMRFMFVPICTMAAVSFLRHDPLYKQIGDFCARRTECYAGCMRDNFPELRCDIKNLVLEYNGVRYEQFFEYPDLQDDSFQFSLCEDYSLQNHDAIPYTQQGDRRQLKIHTCFPACRKFADTFTGFDVDERPPCK